MKFRPTIYVTEQQLQDDKYHGNLKTGQWIQLPSGLKGQWVGRTQTGNLWVCWHKDRRLKIRNYTFKRMVATFRNIENKYNTFSLSA